MEQNIELVEGGLKCDSPSCDWVDKSIKVENYSDWINAKCPKCGENVLTYEDFKIVENLLLSAGIINSFTMEELNEMTKDINIEELKKITLLKDAVGLDYLTNSEPVIISVTTHKELKVTEIKKVSND